MLGLDIAGWVTSIPYEHIRLMPPITYLCVSLICFIAVLKRWAGAAVSNSSSNKPGQQQSGVGFFAPIWVVGTLAFLASLFMLGDVFLAAALILVGLLIILGLIRLFENFKTKNIFRERFIALGVLSLVLSIGSFAYIMWVPSTKPTPALLTAHGTMYEADDGGYVSQEVRYPLVEKIEVKMPQFLDDSQDFLYQWTERKPDGSLALRTGHPILPDEEGKARGTNVLNSTSMQTHVVVRDDLPAGSAPYIVHSAEVSAWRGIQPGEPLCFSGSKHPCTQNAWAVAVVYTVHIPVGEYDSYIKYSSS